MLRLLSITALLFLFILQSFSQQDLGYNIREYTTDNGMPSNGIKGLQWDAATGFLWIATEAGVARFNGLDFTNYTKDNTPGISQERMAYIVKGQKDSIFISDIAGDFFTVSKSTLKSYDRYAAGLGKNIRYRFVTIAPEKLKKRLRELISWDPASGWSKFLLVNDTTCLIINERKELLFVTPSGLKELQTGPGKKFTGGFMISNKSFLVDTEKNVYLVTNSHDEPEKILISEPARSVISSDKGSFYWEYGMESPLFINDKNVWLVEYDHSDIHTTLVCDELPTSALIRWVQYSAANKILFIGTDSKGLIVIKQNRVLPLKKKSNSIAERNSYYSQIELPGPAVVSNEGQIISARNADHLSSPIKGKFNYSVYTTPDSVVWYAQAEHLIGKGCLHSYNLRSKAYKVYYNIPIWETFGLAGRNNVIYVATIYGFGRLQGDSLYYLFKKTDEKSAGEPPITMLEVAPGVFMTASCDGLIRYDVNAMKSDTVLKFPGYCIRSLWKYKDYLFVGTYGKGFFILKNGIARPMPLDKNKFLLYTHCFVKDADGYIWMSTNRGLFKASLEDLITAYEQNISQVYYHYFGKNDGMDMTEMNGGCAPCALLLKNNDISFPTMDGLLWVNPTVADPLLPEGKIFIDYFKADGKNIDPDSATIIKLSSSTKQLEVKLGFSAWCNKENIYLDYRLSDSKTWQPVDVKNDAVVKLYNLSPGNYTLNIRKLNGFGVNNYSYRDISFQIITPWYEKWWFYILAILALFGLIALYLNIKTRQYIVRQKKLEKQINEKTKELQEKNTVLEKNDTIKTRLISIISHDIVTPLKFLTVAGKNLLDKRKMMPEDLQNETIREMTNTSQELQLLSTNILNWIKYQNENRRMVKENFNLYELVNQVVGVLKSIARQKNIELVNDIDETLLIHQYAEPLRILIYNLVSNAINFSEKGKILISEAISDKTVTIKVADEGTGMTPEQVHNIKADQFIISSANVDNKKGNGLGYLIIKDLLKMMSATMEIESEKGKGTKVSVIIPTI